MLKFKVGNKVKILSTGAVDCFSNHGVEVGMVGEVIGGDEDDVYVKHSNFKWGWWFRESDLELVED